VEGEEVVIQVTYQRAGVTYDHLRFRSARFCRVFMSYLIKGGAKVISIKEV
jgi:hypothetical protein